MLKYEPFVGRRATDRERGWSCRPVIAVVGRLVRAGPAGGAADQAAAGTVMVRWAISNRTMRTRLEVAVVNSAQNWLRSSPR